MIIWIDAQLPPAIAAWITQHFNAQLRSILDQTLARAIRLIQAGERLVEIGDRPSSRD
jgi:macrodomain Ter protein organizer (MatP/YcbG family)